MADATPDDQHTSPAVDAERSTLAERRSISLEALKAEAAKNPMTGEEAAARIEALRKNLAAAGRAAQFKPVFATATGLARYRPAIAAAAGLDRFKPSITAARDAVSGLNTGRVAEAAGLLESSRKAGSLGVQVRPEWKNLTGIVPSEAMRVAAGIQPNIAAQVAGDLLRFQWPMQEAAARLSAMVKTRVLGPDFGRFTIPDLDRDFRRLAESFRPRNLRRLELDTEDLWDVMDNEGIPFCLVPDADTVLALLEAPDAAARRAVLVERAGPIFATCNDILDLCAHPAVAGYGSFIRKAIRAHLDGHPEAGQALATNVLDRLVNEHPNKGQLVNKNEAHRILEALPHRDAYFWQPIPGAHAKAYSTTDPVAGFSRHATTHQVAEIQYSAANSVHAIMLATSILGYWANLW